MLGITPLELIVLSIAAAFLAWAFRDRFTVRRVVRSGAILLILFAAAIASLGTIISLGSEGQIARAISNNRGIEATFQEASGFVEDFRRTNSRLPSHSEFDAWCSKHNKHLLWIEIPPSSQEAITKLGQPPNDSYLLVCWRGEWADYFASWSKASTLTFDPARYYQFGGPLYDEAACLATAAAMLLLAAVLWRWA